MAEDLRTPFFEAKTSQLKDALDRKPTNVFDKFDKVETKMMRSNLLVERTPAKDAELAQLMADLGYKGDKNVDEIMEVLNDASKTDAQKELARENLDVLAKSITAVMLLGSAQQRDILGFGSIGVIEGSLPERLQTRVKVKDEDTLAKRILHEIYRNPEVRECLDVLEKIRRRRPPNMREEIIAVSKKLNNIPDDDLNTEQEILMLNVYMSAELAGLDSGARSAGGAGRGAGGGSGFDMPSPDMFGPHGTPDAGGDGSGGDTETSERRSPSWMVKLKNLVKQVKRMEDPGIRTETPPDWFEDLSDHEQEVVKSVIKFNELAMWKERFGEDGRRVMEKTKQDMPGKIIERLYNDKEHNYAFEKAMRMIVQDLYDLKYVENGTINGEKAYMPELQMKLVQTDRQAFGITAVDVDPRVNTILTNIPEYMERLALRIERPDEFHSDSEVKEYLENNKRIEKIKDERGNVIKEVKREIIAKDDFARLECVAAWDMLYFTDVLEASDERRLRKTIKFGRSDLLGAAACPEGKIKSKEILSIEKISNPSNELGDEEPGFGGSISEWANYQKVVNPNFARDVATGRLKIFPTKVGPQFTTIMSAEAGVRNEDGEVVNKREMTLGEALYKGLTVDYSKLKDSETNHLILYKDITEGELTILDFLNGAKEFNMEKNPKFYVDWLAAKGVIRQKKFFNYNADGSRMLGKTYLKAIDDPVLPAAIIANAKRIDKDRPGWTLRHEGRSMYGIVTNILAEEMVNYDPKEKDQNMKKEKQEQKKAILDRLKWTGTIFR